MHNEHHLVAVRPAPARRGWLRRVVMVTAAAGAILAAAVVPSAAAAQTSNPYERGPDPTAAALEDDGPFAVSSTTISNFATPGFGAATIYYPTTTAEGDFGGVVIFPGFTATRSSMAWLAERVASHGFVVLNANTNSIFDFPASRGDQMLDAIDYLRDDSPVASRVDGSRIGVMGHSMGGGGTLEAISDDPSIDAAVPLTPWNLDKTWGEVQTPTMVIGAENDSVASVSSHAIPFYTSLSSSLERAYLELNNASHFAPNSPDDTISLYSIAWLKRYVDDDLRYEQFLCPEPSTGIDISDYRSSCDL